MLSDTAPSFDLSEFVKSYQPLIASIIAVMTAGVTLFVNAWIGRKQQLRQWFKQSEFVRVALLSEAMLLKEQMESFLASRKRDGEGNSLLVPILSHRKVFDSLIGSLGQTSIEQSQAVLSLYLQLEIKFTKMTLFSREHETGKFLIVDHDWKEVFYSQCGYVLQKANDAIIALK